MSLANIPDRSATMQDMTPSHASPKNARTPGLGAAWAVLIGTGVTSVTYNVVHAVPVLELTLALLLGFAPAFVAACLSHVAAVLDAPGWVKAAVIAVMLGGMVLSASNTAAVVAPAEPGWRGWLFGIILDAGALLALWAIMASRRRKNDAAMAVEAAHTETETARTAVREATANAAQIERELATVKAELTAELATVRGELETALQALTSARNRTRSSGQKRRASSPPNKAPASPLNSHVPSDVDTQAEALRILAGEPDISGGELGLRLGKSKRYGCMLKSRLAGSVAGPDTTEQG